MSAPTPHLSGHELDLARENAQLRAREHDRLAAFRGWREAVASRKEQMKAANREVKDAWDAVETHHAEHPDTESHDALAAWVYDDDRLWRAWQARTKAAEAIDGRTKREVEEREAVLISVMSGEGTQLLLLADLSMVTDLHLEGSLVQPGQQVRTEQHPRLEVVGFRTVGEDDERTEVVVCQIPGGAQVEAKPDELSRLEEPATPGRRGDPTKSDEPEAPAAAGKGKRGKGAKAAAAPAPHRGYRVQDRVHHKATGELGTIAELAAGSNKVGVQWDGNAGVYPVDPNNLELRIPAEVKDGAGKPLTQGTSTVRVLGPDKKEAYVGLVVENTSEDSIVVRDPHGKLHQVAAAQCRLIAVSKPARSSPPRRWRVGDRCEVPDGRLGSVASVQQDAERGSTIDVLIDGLKKPKPYGADELKRATKRKDK